MNAYKAEFFKSCLAARAAFGGGGWKSACSQIESSTDVAAEPEFNYLNVIILGCLLFMAKIMSTIIYNIEITVIQHDYSSILKHHAFRKNIL